MAVKKIILGTAGHIDHGKTSFIKALTGIDCDRLKEEKERGITIELGYASLVLPSGTKVGIVDVPGHERFVSKMVAGASGIDVVAFIISADEGVKPQTREHLYICSLLGVKKGIVVLTKTDLVDPEFLELQKMDVMEFLKGSVLEDAPIIPLSSVTGEGLNEFKTALDLIAGDIKEKPAGKPFRLPIDDVVTIKGFGTVVRGTAISGAIKVGEEVVILPGEKKSRIRAMQSHGRTIETGVAGERLALNVSDLKKEDVERGAVVTKHSFFTPSRSLLVEFRYLPYNEKPLKARVSCQFHTLTSRVQAELFLINNERLMPGESGYAMVRLAKPVIASRGDFFVIRGYGIYTTMGGGTILNPVMPSFNKKNLTDVYLKCVSGGELFGLIGIFTEERKYAGVSINELCGLLNESPDTVKIAVGELKKQGTLFEDERGVIYHKNSVATLGEDMQRIVKEYHAENPLKAGINKEELFIKTGGLTSLFTLVLHALAGEKKLELVGDSVKDAVFNPKSSGSDEIFSRIEKIFMEYGLQPDEPAEISSRMKMTEAKLREALSAMTKGGRIVRVKDDYYIHPVVFEKTRKIIAEFFNKKPLLTPQDAREILGLSRKFMIPLLEYMDSIKFTIRVQEGRKLRKQ